MPYESQNSTQISLPSYFTSELEEVIKKENIRGHSIEVECGSAKGENYLGKLFRIKVSGKGKNDEEVTLKLVLKMPLDSENVRDKLPVTKFYLREIFAYNTLQKFIHDLQESYNVPEGERFVFVKCYKTNPEYLKEFLLFEDLCANGFQMADKHHSLSYSHIKVVFKKMAQFHALSFVLKRDDPDKFEYLTKNGGDQQDFEDEVFRNMLTFSMKRAFDSLKDEKMKEKFRLFSKDSVEKMKHLSDPNLAAPYTTMCHGDCWNNNIMFKLQEEDNAPVDCRLLDWQLLRHGSPILDISYVLFTSTDYEFRKKHLSELLEFYHDALGKSLSRMNMNIENTFPKTKFLDHLKIFLPYGLLIASVIVQGVAGEKEDVFELEHFVSEETIKKNISDTFVSEKSADKYGVRMEGAIRTLVELGLL